MLKRVIASILQNYRNALQVGTELIEKKRDNKSAFVQRFRSVLAAMMEDYQQPEQGVYFEISSGGYMVYYKNAFLFRASVVEFSERAEVLVDHERVVIYNGNSPATEKDYEHCETIVKATLLSTFKTRLRIELEKELNRI